MINRFLEWLGWFLWTFLKFLLILIIIRLCLPFFGFNEHIPLLDDLIDFIGAQLKGLAHFVHSFNLWRF